MALIENVSLSTIAAVQKGLFGLPFASSGPIVSDAFTGTDGTALTAHPADTGQAWTAITGGTNWKISGGLALLAASSGNEIIVLDSGVSVCSVQATLTGITANNAGLMFSLTDASNFWGLWGGLNGLFLVKCAAGASTIPASDAVAVAEGSVLKVTRDGPSITCYVNGTQRLTLSDAHNAGATKHGLGIGGADTNHRWDNFQVS